MIKKTQNRIERLQQLKEYGNKTETIRSMQEAEKPKQTPVYVISQCMTRWHQNVLVRNWQKNKQHVRSIMRCLCLTDQNIQFIYSTNIDVSFGAGATLGTEVEKMSKAQCPGALAGDNTRPWLISMQRARAVRYEVLWKPQERSSKLTYQGREKFLLEVENAQAKAYRSVGSVRGGTDLSSLVS